MDLEARIYTHENVRELNDKWVEIIEFQGETVLVKLYDLVTGKPFEYSLKLSDLKAIRGRE